MLPMMDGFIMVCSVLVALAFGFMYGRWSSTL